MDIEEKLKIIFGPKKESNRRFTNESSQSTVQVKRLDNYSENLMMILDEYAEEINSTLLPYNRKSCEETMMVTGVRKSSQDTTNRKMHMDNMEGIAAEIAKKLGLCVGATRLIARHHDIGHTFYGHAGERWLSNAKEDLGIGFYKHNALGPQELIYQRHIYDEILNRIKEFNPEIKEKELSRIRKSLWLLFDGINAHNGEKTETEFIPFEGKTEKDFLDELAKCFIVKDYDKTIVPATMEGCLIRLCDKISYIPYDMVDGIREGFIDKIDGEYIPVLEALGISKGEIDSCNTRKNYDAIIRKLQITFTKDVIKNSTSSAIRMSEEISRHMHELRNINNRKIVKYTILAEENDIYPRAIKTLIKSFADIAIENGILEELEYGEISLDDAKAMVEKYKDTPYEDFARYLTQISHDDYEFTEETVYQATLETIAREQKIARDFVQGKRVYAEEKGYENRDARIKRYIEHYKSIGLSEDYSTFDISRDIDKEFSREELEGVNSGFDYKIASEIGVRYLSKLNDFEILNLIKSAGLITEEQAKSLTRTYKEIGHEGLEREVNMQKELVELMKDQHAETAKLTAKLEQNKKDEEQEER